METSKRSLVWLGCISLVAFFIRSLFWRIEGIDDAWWLYWSQSLLDTGLGGSYLREASHLPINYPPVYIYLLAGLSKLLQALQLSDYLLPILRALTAAADIGASLLLYDSIRRKSSETTGIIVAALYVLNPVIWYQSAVWGQNDGIIAFLIISTIWAAERKKPIITACCVALGLLTKFQFIVWLPFLLLYLVATWKWKEWKIAIVSGLAAIALLLLPLIQQGALAAMVTHAYTTAAGYYPYLSLNAYNLWWMQVTPTTWQLHLDTVQFFPPLTAHQLGLIIFGACVSSNIAWFWFRSNKSKEAMALAAAVSQISFFAVNTQMHERYLFPFFILFLAALPLNKKYWLLFVSLSLTTFFNLIAVQKTLAPTWFLANLQPASLAISLCVVLCWLVSQWSLSTDEDLLQN